MGPDFSKRQGKIRKLMEEKGIDVLLLSGQEDIYYYTGYSGLREDRLFLILPFNDKPKLIATPLESEARLRYRNTILIDSVKDFMTEFKGYEKIGFDEKQLNVLLFKEMEKLKAKLEPFGKSLEIPRTTKDAYEIRQIREAIRITGKVFGSLPPLSGKTEARISNEIDILFRKHGVDNAFENIVSSGPQGFYVHHKPNERTLKKKDVVLIDIGCRSNGYCSDIGRTFCRRSGKRERKIYGDLKAIHDGIVDFIRAGISYSEVEDLQKTLFSKNGYKVIHSFGHGVGLTVHDPTGDVLKENMVLTVEPGIYIKNMGGFRIEDMVLVKKGKALMLSDSITSE